MTNIFVGNLSFDTTDSDLQAAFESYGSVERASVVRDRDTGRSRGFAFVEMTNPTEANQAMTALNGQDLNGRSLNVNEARPKESTGGQSRQGSGGRRRENRW